VAEATVYKMEMDSADEDIVKF